jgi:hypothetical protein
MRQTPVPTNPTLRDELLKMRDLDQAMQTDPTLNPPGPGRDARIRETFRRHNGRLRGILNKHGWPDKSMVGADGSEAFWLLVQHADEDLRLQRQALAALERAVAYGRASRQNLAYLADRVRVNSKQKQLFGTQLAWEADGKPRPKPCEDEPNLDTRRAAMGLPPIAEYLKFSYEAIQELRAKLDKK